MSVINKIKNSKSLKHSSIIIRLLALTFFSWLVYIYTHLDIGTAPKPVDVIIVIEGMAFDRGQKGVELLERGFSESDRLIISPPEATLVQWYINAGAEPHQLIMEPEATSTWTNATNTIEIMEDQGWDSAIVVTTDYHTRRARLSFERASRGLDMDFTFVSSQTMIGGQPYPYLETHHTRMYGLSDTMKYVGYILGLYHWIDL